MSLLDGNKPKDVLTDDLINTVLFMCYAPCARKRIISTMRDTKKIWPDDPSGKEFNINGFKVIFLNSRNYNYLLIIRFHNRRQYTINLLDSSFEISYYIRKIVEANSPSESYYTYFPSLTPPEFNHTFSENFNDLLA